MYKPRIMIMKYKESTCNHALGVVVVIVAEMEKRQINMEKH